MNPRTRYLLIELPICLAIGALIGITFALAL